MDIAGTIKKHSVACLATFSTEHAGYPFNSIVQYDVDDSNNLVIYISNLAEHCKNIQSNPKGNIFIFDPEIVKDPLSSWRISILCNFEKVGSEEFEKYYGNYRVKFPKSKSNPELPGFELIKCIPVATRWIDQGFGKMGWV